MLAAFWRRRVLGPEEIVHARKARDSRTRVCDIDKHFWGKDDRTVRATARHWFGDELKNITCAICRERLRLPCL